MRRLAKRRLPITNGGGANMNIPISRCAFKTSAEEALIALILNSATTSMLQPSPTFESQHRIAHDKEH